LLACFEYIFAYTHQGFIRLLFLVFTQFPPDYTQTAECGRRPWWLLLSHGFMLGAVGERRAAGGGGGGGGGEGGGRCFVV